MTNNTHTHARTHTYIHEQGQKLETPTNYDKIFAIHV